MKSTSKFKLYFFILGFLLIIFFSGLYFYTIQQKVYQKENGDQIKYLIGMSQANLIEPWRIVMNNEIKVEANRHEDVRIIFKDAAQNSQKQIKDVYELLDEGIALLVISPNEAEVLMPVIQEAYKKIPVIVLNRDVEGDNYTLFIGPNNRLIGKQAGDLVAELLGDDGGNVIEIQGLSGSPPVRDRSEGFREVILKHKNIKILDSLVADWLKDKAEDKLKEIITRYPKIDLVFAHNDAMALGAYIAAKKFRINNIKFIGIDGLPGVDGGIQLVKDRILNGTFTSPTGGKEAVQYAIRILNKEKGLPRRVTLESKRITIENLP